MKRAIFVIDSGVSININDTIKVINNVADKKNTIIVYNGTYHTPYDAPNYIPSTLLQKESSFYDQIVSVLKRFSEFLYNDVKCLIHVIDNSNDILDYSNKIELSNILDKAISCEIVFHTNNSENQLKAFDFKVLPNIYSSTTAGTQLMIAKIEESCIKFCS